MGPLYVTEVLLRTDGHMDSCLRTYVAVFRVESSSLMWALLISNTITGAPYCNTVITPPNPKLIMAKPTLPDSSKSFSQRASGRGKGQATPGSTHS